MLNLELEKKEFLEEKRLEYDNKHYTILGLFLGEKRYFKKRREYLEKIENLWVHEKLASYYEEVKEERKRIDKQIEEMNKKFDEWLKKNDVVICRGLDGTKPVKLRCTTFSETTPILQNIEMVRVQIEPFAIGFRREKIEN